VSAPLRFDPIDQARRHWQESGWPEAADGMAAVTSIMRAHQLVLAAVDAVLRPMNLTFARYELLMLLRFSGRGALPLAVIGSRLQVHPTSVTSAVDRLERDGLVCREPHPTDRRTTLARLTPAGRRLAGQATERLNAGVFTALPLTEEQLGALVGAIRSMRAAAGDFA
jgi:DNA-binding MarR family transcriptional regulator